MDLISFDPSPQDRAQSLSPGTDLPVRTRRSAGKSRSGCSNCKEKRIKVRCLHEQHQLRLTKSLPPSSCLSAASARSVPFDAMMTNASSAVRRDSSHLSAVQPQTAELRLQAANQDQSMGVQRPHHPPGDSAEQRCKSRPSSQGTRQVRARGSRLQQLLLPAYGCPIPSVPVGHQRRTSRGRSQ